MCIYRGGRKPKTMMSMVEGEYLDPSMTTNENEVMNDKWSKGDNHSLQRAIIAFFLTQLLFETISFYNTILSRQ